MLDSMEDEYRQPRLQTLQLALLVLTSRPTLNSGQNSIGIARVRLSVLVTIKLHKLTQMDHRLSVQLSFSACTWIRASGSCPPGRSRFASGYGGVY